MKNTCFVGFLLGVLLMALPSSAQTNPFVRVKDGQFLRNDKPYYYVGTNFWFGAILGSEGQGGNRLRLCQELDFMKSKGINNLRVLVGADGCRNVPSKVEPTLQTAAGEYNDTILAGLDFLLDEMHKRDMVAVLYLNNSWEWSGGYGFYLEQAGEGKAPLPSVDGWPAYMDFVKKFAQSKKAHQIFYDYVKFIVGRINRYNGRKYVDDPTIMSWQIGNEPRAFSEDAKVKAAFAKWMAETSALIKGMDANHMVSTGSEGLHGCEYDAALLEKIHADKNIDYINCHLWPYNWGWAHEKTLLEDLDNSCKKAKEYIDKHLVLAKKLQKPLVMEEFGYPRDGFRFDKNASTKARDGFYKYVFGLIVEDSQNKGLFAGCNFWAWGGFANPQHTNWKVGDDYTGDPAQEQQGLNSVFASDYTTLQIISDMVDKFGR